ncbi:syncytin-1-like [Brienomyrus brachyistius]|uniref:syncytin-1-like n=1 Tax=Brienomyrus brachyistius TaxID=42636 RepID=UPI0020B2564A|nr:syncytin-1-like [Brienomyrus brachyistius]
MVKGVALPEDGLAVIPVNGTVCFHLSNSTQTRTPSSPPLHCKAYVNFSVLGDVLLVAPPRSAFICGRKDFLKGYTVLSLSKTKADWYCYLAYLVPPIRVVPKAQMSLAVRAYTRSRRSLSRTEQWFGVFIPSLGVADLQTEVAALQTAVEKVANQTLDTVKAVSGELSAVRQVALQNRMALDLLLAEKGGVCAIVGRECCTYIPDSTQAVQDLEDVVHKQMSEVHKEHGLFEYSWDYWFSSLIPGLSGVFRPLVFSVVLLLVVLLLIFLLFRCCSSILSSQANSVMFLRAPPLPYADDPLLPAWFYDPQPRVVVHATGNADTAGDSCSIQPTPARFDPLRNGPAFYYTADSDCL